MTIEGFLGIPQERIQEQARRAAESMYPSTGNDDQPRPKAKAFVEGYINALDTVRFWLRNP